MVDGSSNVSLDSEKVMLMVIKTASSEEAIQIVYAIATSDFETFINKIFLQSV